MTLESRINRNRYIGNGATTQFPFTFKIWKTDQILVYTGNGTTEEEVSSDCTVTITASGGTVTFPEAPAYGTVIVIRRNMPYIQEDDYRNGTCFNSEEIEDRFDQDCAERQDLLLGVEMAVKVPETSSVSGNELVRDLMQARDDVVFALENAGDVTGATLVVARGTTGPRALQDRFADVLNVRDFGAVGDGVADDTAAFTAAQNSGAQAVIVPNGTYKITENVAGTFFSFGEITTTGGGDVEIIDILSFDSIPTGTVLWLSTPSVPAGYLLCNGAAVGRATYPDLFAAIGTTYGAGDGSTTFNLPNLIDKFAQGSAVAGTVKDAGLPNITGTFAVEGVGGSNITGAFQYEGSVSASGAASSDDSAYKNSFNASRSSAIYGNSDTVQPPALTLLPCIKAFSSVVGDAAVVAGQLVNEIQSKVALDGSNLSGAAVKTVVETWHSGTEWYRVWSDGWIEQGGTVVGDTTVNPFSLVFQKPFTTADYFIAKNLAFNSIDAVSGFDQSFIARTTTYANTRKASGVNFWWYACGF